MKRTNEKIAVTLLISLSFNALLPICAHAETPTPPPAPSISGKALGVISKASEKIAAIAAPDPEDLRLKAVGKKSLGDYFSQSELNPSSLSMDATKLSGGNREKLEKDILDLIHRGGRKNAWDEAEFKKWWEANKNSIVTPAQMKSWKDMPVEVLLGVAFTRFAAEQADGNKTKLEDMLRNLVQNEWAAWAIGGAVGAVTAVGTFLFNTVYTAFTVAVIGDIIKSYLDPVTKTIREAGGVVGAQQTAWFAVPLNEKGQGFIDRRQRKAAEKKRLKQEKLRAKAQKQGLTLPPPAEEMAKLEVQAAELQAKLPELAAKTEALGAAELTIKKMPDKANELLDAISFPGLTVKQMEGNLNGFNKQWSEMVASWNSNLLPTSQAGRNLMIDAVVFRPKDFMRDSAMFDTKMEAYRHGIETSRDKAMAKFDDKARAVEQKTNERLHLIGGSEGSASDRKAAMEAALAEKEAALSAIAAERESTSAALDKLLSQTTDLAEAQFDLKPADWAKLDELKNEIIKSGVFSPSELAELIDRQKSKVLGRRQMIGAVAAQMIHDMMFPEFNTKMPESISQMFRVMQKQFGFPYVEERFRPEIQKILHETQLAIGEQAAAARSALVEATVESLKAQKALADAKALEAAMPKARPTARQVAANMMIVKGIKAAGTTCAEKFKAIGGSTNPPPSAR